VLEEGIDSPIINRILKWLTIKAYDDKRTKNVQTPEAYEVPDMSRVTVCGTLSGYKPTRLDYPIKVV